MSNDVLKTVGKDMERRAMTRPENYFLHVSRTDHSTVASRTTFCIIHAFSNHSNCFLNFVQTYHKSRRSKEFWPFQNCDIQTNCWLTSPKCASMNTYTASASQWRSPKQTMTYTVPSLENSVPLIWYISNEFLLSDWISTPTYRERMRST